jgi:hypothetical protein
MLNAIGMARDLNALFTLGFTASIWGLYFLNFSNQSKSIAIKSLGVLFVINFFALSCVIISYDKLSTALETYKILFFIS